MVMWGRSVHLTTLFFLGKLEQVLRTHTFACNFLNESTTLLERIQIGGIPERIFLRKNSQHAEIIYHKRNKIYPINFQDFR